MRWSRAELDDYTMRRRAAIKRYAGHTMSDLADTFQPDPGLESKLQGKIEAWAKERGHPILSFRQSPHVRMFLPPGWPDVAIILPKGRAVWVELKSRTGRLSDAQKLTKLEFMHHGHHIHEVRSYRQFLSIIELGGEIGRE